MLFFVIVVMLSRSSGPALLQSAYGANPPPIAGGGGVYIMPGQLSTNTWGCYLLDIDSQVICAYQFLPGDKQLRLLAARNFTYDRKLKNYNTMPDPLEMKDLLEREQQAARGSDAADETSPRSEADDSPENTQ